MRRIRTAVIGIAALCAAAILPAAASAAGCTLPSAKDDYLSGGTTQTFSGHFGPELNGEFVQIPFEVGSGISGLRVRYCYTATDPGENSDNQKKPTLDLGVYGPKPPGQDGWMMDQRRGWSGSAVKTIGIGENGYTNEATYVAARRNYVPGYTTRAYKPGPIAAGKWAVELGGGWIQPDGQGVDWKVEVITSTAPEWADATDDVPADTPYQPYTANPNPGWYAGDVHVHGEMEPGNAPMNQTFTKGFGPFSAGGSGLDFMTIVDHNNDNSRGVLGSYKDEYPGKLIIPGIEVTTYNGHTNAQYSSYFPDFRMSALYRWDDAAPGDGIQTASELSKLRGPIDPSSQFEQLLAGDGWTQVNHPTIYKAAPAACRGCAWNYSDAQTDFSKVSAIEIQTGPAGLPASAPAAMNPFTLTAIEYYEHALATGAHIAAVGSSDDHQGGTAPSDPIGLLTYSPVGRGATVVHANQLSTRGVIDAVKAGHTYVKPFGADAPDVEMVAGEPGKVDLAALPGDSVTGPSMNIQIHVAEAGASATRPGPYTLAVLQDGIMIDSVAVTSDDFDHNLKVTETGRYSFELTRLQGDKTMIEAYSTPVWFTREASNAFSFKRFKANRKQGTATLKVKVVSLGKLTLTGPGLKKATARVKKKNQTVTLKLKPKASLKKKLRKKGSARVRVKVTNRPVGGKALTRSKQVKLLGKKVKKKRRH